MEHRLLLTGTPIQNNIEELWTLLHFIESKKFNSLPAFSSDFGGMTSTDQVC